MKDVLTNAEWIVMSALWDRPPQALSEVIKNIGDEVDWSYKTYASYLRILCKKGLVGFKINVRDKLYYPLIEQEECLKIASKNLLKKVSKNGTKDLLVYMIQESTLSLKDHADLQQLLKSLSNIDSFIEKEGDNE